MYGPESKTRVSQSQPGLIIRNSGEVSQSCCSVYRAREKRETGGKRARNLLLKETTRGMYLVESAGKSFMRWIERGTTGSVTGGKRGEKCLSGGLRGQTREKKRGHFCRLSQPITSDSSRSSVRIQL